MRAYEDVQLKLPLTTVRDGLSGKGLFAMENIRSGRRICEYIGNRISYEQEDEVEAGLHEMDKDINVFADVPSIEMVIDTRGCGNKAMFANHSCDENAILKEWEVPRTGKVLVFLYATKFIRMDTEILLNYGFDSIRTSHVIMCDCGSKQCQKYI